MTDMFQNARLATGWVEPELTASDTGLAGGNVCKAGAKGETAEGETAEGETNVT